MTRRVARRLLLLVSVLVATTVIAVATLKNSSSTDANRCGENLACPSLVEERR